MFWSISVGNVAGTAVRLHITFVLFLLWIGIASGLRGGTGAAADAVLYMLALFGCVLLHEFGHVFAARRYGIKTPEITLLPIGGVASLERMPEKPAQEIVVALAGPAVNVVIALVLWLFFLQPNELAADLNDVATSKASLAARLFAVNIFLVLFNLLPAFPMDGGRVLRAALATRMPYARATSIAAMVGQGFAFLLGFLGLFGNPLLIFIAIFVYLAAAGEAGHAQFKEASRGMVAGDAMITRLEWLGPQSSLNDAIECLIRTTQKEFPVVDGAARLRGVLTRDAMIVALRQQGPHAPVLEVMTADIPTVNEREPLQEALRVLQASGAPAVGVLSSDQRFLGLITPENMGELMMIQAVQPDRQAWTGPWGQPR